MSANKIDRPRYTFYCECQTDGDLQNLTLEPVQAMFIKHFELGHDCAYEIQTVRAVDA